MQNPIFNAGTQVDTIPVSINYDIIYHFSEGLYSSPHKAIEELVSNSYDAGERRASTFCCRTSLAAPMAKRLICG